MTQRGSWCRRPYTAATSPLGRGAAGTADTAGGLNGRILDRAARVVEAGSQAIPTSASDCPASGGPWPGPTPSSPCAAARPAASGNRSGRGPATRQPPPDPARNSHATPATASYPSVTYKWAYTRANWTRCARTGLAGTLDGPVELYVGDGELTAVGSRLGPASVVSARVTEDAARKHHECLRAPSIMIIFLGFARAAWASRPARFGDLVQT